MYFAHLALLQDITESSRVDSLSEEQKIEEEQARSVVRWSSVVLIFCMLGTNRKRC